MTYPNLQQWTVAFDKAVRDILSTYPAQTIRAFGAVQAHPCQRHPNSCVAVLCGEILNHFTWAKTDPAQLAQTLLVGMLPSL